MDGAVETWVHVCAVEDIPLLGSRVLEGWGEVADFNARVLEVGLAGGTLSFQNQELTLYRNNVPEQVWMDLNYGPVLGEDG